VDIDAALPADDAALPSQSLVPRARDGRWLPGARPNPGGRPRQLVTIVELARKHTPLAISTLASIAADASATDFARIAAATALLDRGWGKPPQSAAVAEEEQTVIVLNIGGPDRRQPTAVDAIAEPAPSDPA